MKKPYINDSMLQVCQVHLPLFLLAAVFCRLLITFAKGVTPDQNGQNGLDELGSGSLDDATNIISRL